ncbi:MAG TPA: HD domain-containing phosphohydrolase [Acidimicrobiales bacterium]
MSSVVVVEDEHLLRRALRRLLEREGHSVRAAATATEARQVAPGCDLVLCDVGLPDGDGISVIEELRIADPSMAALVLTGADRAGVADRAIAAGVQGYLLKPFDQGAVAINVANALRWRELDLDNRRHRDHLERLVLERTDDVVRTQEEMVRRLAAAAESRDLETAEHLDRMSRLSGFVAQLIGLESRHCELIRLAAPMHDVGKLGVPDWVLNHDGPLDDEQWAEMRRHPELGHRILAGSKAPLIQCAATIALTHHERWDGTGYPRGLAGTDIPIEGRIVAIADVFDALCSARRYKPAYGLTQSLEIMVAERGTHFDPDLLDAFVATGDRLGAVRAGEPLVQVSSAEHTVSVMSRVTT